MKPSRDYLEPITSKIKTKKFCVYDIESKDGDTQKAGFTRPFLVGFFNPETCGYQEFRDEPHLKKRAWQTRHIEPGGCIDKLLNVVLVPELSGYIFYAHNGGNFDHLFLLAWLRRHQDEFGFEIIPVQSSIQVLKVWRWPEEPDAKPTETWDFLDSMKLLPMGLAKACDTFDVETKIDHDLNRHEDDPSWGDYLFQDCKSLSLVMLKLYELVGRLGGEVGITTPSTSMKLFRRKYMGQYGTPDKIPRHQHWPGCQNRGTKKKAGTCLGCAHEWIRRGYYGGRTEILRLFGLALHYFDINSSYVAAMMQDMPIGDRVIEYGTLDWRKHRSASNPKGKYTGFCECTVYIPPTCPIPPLPHKDTKTGKLIFPTGRFHGVWSVEELALLDDPLVQGKIEHIVCTVWFRLMPMFGSMVAELWKLRDPKLPGFDEGLSALAKLLGNGIYGKFAMRQERTSVVFAHNVSVERCFLCKEPALAGGLCPECEGSKPAQDSDPDGDVWYQKKMVDAPYIIPHVSSHITALARVRLWHFMQMALRMRGPTQDRAGDLAIGDVVWPEDAAELVLERHPAGAMIRVRLRHLATCEERDAIWPLDHLVPAGGKVFYCDTDSIITDVMLPCGSVLGGLKDEYPGDELNYLAVQPKVYVIERSQHNARVAEAKALLAAAERGELNEEKTAQVKARVAEGEAMVARSKEQSKRRTPAFEAVKAGTEAKIDPWSIDPIVLKPHSKVTMKGFPPKMRTRENLETLRGGAIDWEALKSGVMPPTGKGGTLEWEQLEKVRSLARAGFHRPPMMRAGHEGNAKALHAVSKSFRSAYDKRRIMDDGSGRTMAVVLDEPIGGCTDEAAE